MKVKIRKLSLLYAKELKQIINNKEIKWCGKYISHSYHLSKVKKYILGQLKLKNYLEFAILVDNKFVGTISLEKIDKIKKEASIGYWVAKSYRGKGIATKAVKLVVSFGFKKLKLKRIYAKVKKSNIQSLRVLDNAGFEKKGMSKNEYYYRVVKLSLNPKT